MRRSTRTQQQKITVLLVTNGEKTEQKYLDLLKDAILKKHGKTYSVKVDFLAGAPVNLPNKLTKPTGDASAYDQVWLFVDKDNFPLAKFITDCRKEDKKREKENNKGKKKGKLQPGHERVFRAVVSNPCFEVWLAAFFGKVSRYHNQNDAQRHYESLAGLSSGTKDLPASIDLSKLAEQCDQAKLPNTDHIELSSEGASPGTAIPNVLKFYGLV